MTASACGGSAGGDDGEVTLRMSWWGSDSRHQLTQELIDAFEAEHPGITIEPEFTGWDDYWDRLATSAAGNNIPDVMQQDTRYVREYADRDALLDLNEYIPGTLDTSKLDPSVTATGQVDGATYAIPTGINAYTVVTDPEIYQQAGMELPDDETWSWDEFIDTAAKLTRETPGGTYGTQNIGFVETGLEVFARQRGESLFDENDKLGVSDETLADWFRLILESSERKAEPRPSLTVETQAGGVDQSLLATNKGAMGTWWTNELPTLTGSAGHELTLLRFPGESQAEQPGMYFKPAMFWAASSRSEHPEEAATFINWLVNSPKAAQIQLSDRGLPINTELRERISDDLEAPDQQSAKFLEKIGTDLADPPALPPPGAGEVQDILLQINEQLLFGRLSADQAAQQFRDQASAAIG
ncbi:MAG: extracellular solute-binding protein [Actinophytocola sp.]|nr:extracellular solute-binding protein [Actinophytocola sp.]